MLSPCGQWHFNTFGHVEIVFENDASLYLQSEDDVSSFFDMLGLGLDELCVGDWDELPVDIALDYYELVCNGGEVE